MNAHNERHTFRVPFKGTLGLESEGRTSEMLSTSHPIDPLNGSYSHFAHACRPPPLPHVSLLLHVAYIPHTSPSHLSPA